MPRGDIIGRTIPFVGLIDEIAPFHNPYNNHTEMVSLADQGSSEDAIVNRIKAKINYREITEGVLVLIETDVDNGTTLVSHEPDLIRAAALLNSEDAPTGFAESLALHCFVSIPKTVRVFTTGREAFEKFRETRE